MTLKNEINAIASLRPNASFSISDDDLTTLKFADPEIIPPTLAEIQKEVIRLAEEELAAENQKKLAREALLMRLGITEEEAKLIIS